MFGVMLIAGYRTSLKPYRCMTLAISSSMVGDSLILSSLKNRESQRETRQFAQR
jgi:hypothetical protein